MADKPTVTDKLVAMTPTPLPHWKRILKHAWSIRLIVLAIVLSGLEAAWPYLDGILPIPRGLFAMLSGFVSAAAIYARLIVQKPLSGNQDEPS